MQTLPKDPRDAVVVSAVRSAIGRGKKGALRHTRPDDLLGQVLAAALARAPGLAGEQLDDVIVGTATPEAEQGLNVARIGLHLAGLPDSVPAFTLNRFCASGLQAVASGAAAIRAGWADAVLAGGVESMSLLPMGGHHPMPHPGLADSRPEVYIPMGLTAERVAERWGVSRKDQDAFALRSHEKALDAIQQGRFVGEIAPVQATVFDGNGASQVSFQVDEGPRAGSSLDDLAKLKPAFKPDGTVTAATSSQVSDGAAAVLVLSRELADRLGLPILARLRAMVTVGLAPDIMGMGPLYAIPKALLRAGLAVEDIDVFEINEAFAAQAIPCVRELGIPMEKVNPNGGAIALGHPLGCSGARMTATLLPEVTRRSGRFGVVSMCIGGGMGSAAIFEREG